MLLIEKVLNQVRQLVQKRRKHSKVKNESDIHIILEHEFAPFSSSERAYGFLYRDNKKQPRIPNWILIIAVSAKSSRHISRIASLLLSVSKIKIKWRILSQAYD